MRKTKALIALVLVISMVIAFLPVKALALSEEEKSSYAEIHLRKATGITVENGVATITYEGGSAEVSGLNLVGEVNDNWNYGDHTGTMVILYTKSTELQFATTPGEGKTATAWDNGQPTVLTNNTYTLSNILTKAQNNNGYDVEFTFEGQQGGNNNPGQNNPGQNNPQNPQLIVSFRDGSAGKGKVQYSVNNANWNDLNGTSNIPLNENDAVKLKVVPNGSNTIDFGGMELTLDGQHYQLGQQANSDKAGALVSAQGYTVPAGVKEIRLENVEFRQEENNQEEFNGVVWFVWNDNGALCKYKIEGVEPANQGENETIEYKTKYVDAAQVKDGTHTLNISKVLTSGNEEAKFYFVNANKYDLIKNITTWAQMKQELKNIFEDYDELQAFAYDPCGAKDGKNSISTNGNRIFRITIFNSGKYYGLTNATTANDVTYYPTFWDKKLFNPITDVYGSTLENPAVLETYIGEPVIKLDSDRNSAKIDKIEVASDINDGAVQITKVDGKFQIKFNSNYYDKVVFKITSGNNVYYVRISRINMNILSGIDYDEEGNQIERKGVDLFVPTTDNEDYKIMATYYLKDGTKISRTLESKAGGNGGQNLKLKHYELPTDIKNKIETNPNAKNPVVSAYFTVVKPNSTPTLYKGTLSGSGKGIHYTVSNGKFVRDYTK